MKKRSTQPYLRWRVPSQTRSAPNAMRNSTRLLVSTRWPNAR